MESVCLIIHICRSLGGRQHTLFPARVRLEGQLVGPEPHSLLPLHLLFANRIVRDMGLPVIPVQAGCPAAGVPPSDGLDSLALEQAESFVSIPQHPLGVKPSGNQYTASSNTRYAIGFFQMLPDEVLATVLEYLDALHLGLLGSCCKFLYAFCRSEDFWKTLFIE